MINEKQNIDDIKELTLENSSNNTVNRNLPQADSDFATIKQLNTEASMRAETDYTLFNHFEKWKTIQTTQINDLYTNKSEIAYVDARLNKKQDKLLSGTNLRTINNQSLLGVGNITISGGSGVTKEYVDDQDALKADITYVDDQDALKADTTYVDTQDATKQNTLVDNGANQNIKTINSQSLLGSGNIDISAESTPLDNNIEIYDNESNNFVAYIMDPLDWTKANNKSIPNKKYVDTQDALKADKTYVDNELSKKSNTDEVGTALTKKADKTYVDDQDALKADITYVDSQDALKADTTYVDSQDALKADKTYVDTQDATKQNITDNSLNTTNKTVPGAINELQTSINTNATNIDLKQNITDNSLTTTDKTVPGAINELVTNKADTTYVDTQDATKQNTLVDNGANQNIKTINNQSILGTGNLDISGGGSTPLDNNIEIYDNESNNFVAYIMDPLDWTKANDKSIPNKKYVDSQNVLKQNITDDNLTTADQTVVGAINELEIIKTDFIYVDGQLNNKQNITDNSLTTADQTVVGAINELQTKINNFSWKPVAINGARTRQADVIGLLKVGATYRIAYTWSESPDNSIIYKEYTHKNSVVTDLERYWHSGVAGLLPNILSLRNLGANGFQIYASSGTQRTHGFIVSVDILS